MYITFVVDERPSRQRRASPVATFRGMVMLD